MTDVSRNLDTGTGTNAERVDTSTGGDPTVRSQSNSFERASPIVRHTMMHTIREQLRRRAKEETDKVFDQWLKQHGR
jgi:hypothetical protein